MPVTQSQRNAGSVVPHLISLIPVVNATEGEKCVLYPDYDAFEHLCSALFLEEDSLVAVLTAYFDESYNHPNPNRANEPLVYTVGCWLSTAEKWKKFGRRWKRILRTAGVDYFHMTDYESRKKLFSDWSERKRLRVLQELHNAIRDYHIYGNAVVVSRNDWDVVIKPDADLRKRYGATHYGFCVKTAMMLIAEWCDKNKQDAPIQYVFAELEKQGGVLDPLFRKILNSSELRKKFRVENTWNKSVMKQVPPIQAADILAFELNKRAANHMSTLEIKFVYIGHYPH